MKHIAKTLFKLFIAILYLNQIAYSNPLLLKEIERTENLIQILEFQKKTLIENGNLESAKNSLKKAREMQLRNKFGIALKSTFEAKQSIFNLLDSTYGASTSKTVKNFFQTENFLEKIRPDVRKAQNFESINTFILANEKLDSARIEMRNVNFLRAKTHTDKANYLAQTAYKMAKINNADLTETDAFNFIKITDSFLRKAKGFISIENYNTAKNLQDNAWQNFSAKDFHKAVELSESVRKTLKTNFNEEFGEDNLSTEFVENLLLVAHNRINLLQEKIKTNPSKRKMRILKRIKTHFNKAKNEFQNGDLKGAVLELKICRNIKNEIQED